MIANARTAESSKLDQLVMNDFFRPSIILFPFRFVEARVRLLDVRPDTWIRENRASFALRTHNGTKSEFGRHPLFPVLFSTKKAFWCFVFTVLVSCSLSSLCVIMNISIFITSEQSCFVSPLSDYDLLCCGCCSSQPFFTNFWPQSVFRSCLAIVWLRTSCNINRRVVNIPNYERNNNSQRLVDDEGRKSSSLWRTFVPKILT